MATGITNAPGFWANMDPANSGSLLDLQRKQMLAQMLMQQSQGDLTSTPTVGGMAIRRSPLEGIAKLAQAYVGNKLMSDYAEKMGQLNAEGYAKMTGQPTMGSPNQGPQEQVTSPLAAALSQGAAQGSIGPTNDNAQRLGAALQPPPVQAQAAPQPAPLAPGGSLNPGNMPAQLASFGMMSDPGAYFTAQASAVAPTPEMKMAAQVYGVNSPQYKAALEAQVQKAGYIAPINVRPGGTVYDPVKNKPVFAAPDSRGTQVQYGPGGPTMGMVPGALAAEQAAAYAKTSGEGLATPQAGFAGNQPTFTNRTAAAGGNMLSNPLLTGQAPTLNVTKDPADFKRQIEAIKDPAERDAMLAVFNRQFPGGVAPEPPLGARTAAEGQQTQLGKKFADLQQQNSQAQTTTSYLQSIKQLAATASTGQFSDKQKFINSLLATAGISEKATDAVTANNLLDKYGNQIVSRLGQGGLGTDAARSILQSAYPNAHMTPQAINEAADNLIGANEMVKAKMRMLAPHGNAQDPIGYQQKEQAFDQAADPRLWQLKGMTPQDAQAYLSKMPPNVRADLQQRAKALKAMGAL